MKNQKLFLFATLGFPGAGKTYFSRKFAKEFTILHLSSDRIRKALFKTPRYSRYEHMLVFNVMDALAEEALGSGISVIYDANSSRRSDRRQLMKIAEKCGAQYMLLRFHASYALAKRRLGIRKRCTRKVCQEYHPPAPLEVLDRLRKSIELPDEHEPHVIIKGADTYAKQKKAVLSAIS